MKQTLFAIAVLTLCLSAFSADVPAKERSLVHIVCLKFKEGTTPDQIKNLQAQFRAMKDKISEIQSLECGSNISPERAKGFEFCAVVRFKSKEDLDKYIPHPEHQKLATGLKDLVADVFVSDFFEP